jgi:hypothetical protein
LSCSSLLSFTTFYFYLFSRSFTVSFLKLLCRLLLRSFIILFLYTLFHPLLSFRLYSLSLHSVFFPFPSFLGHLCGLVVRVLGCRPRGPGFD